MGSGSTLRAVHLEILQLPSKASPGGSGEPLHERAHHISLDRLPPEDCKSRQGFDQHIDESQFWDHPVQGHPPQTPSWYWGFNQLQKRCRRTRRHDKLLKVKLRKDKLRKDKLRKDKLQKDKLLTRQTPDETNSWWDKLLKIKSSEIQTPKYQIWKNVSQFIFNLAAALGPESVIT